MKLEGFGIMVDSMPVMVRFYRDVLGFEIKEVDKAFEAVTAAGRQAVMPPTTEPWGQRTCYVADPEGNLIEIGSFEKGEL